MLNTVFVAFAGEFKGASLWINNRRSEDRKRRSADSVQILDDNLDKILHGLQKCLRVTSLRGIPKFGPKGGRFLTTGYSALYTKYGPSYGWARDINT